MWKKNKTGNDILSPHPTPLKKQPLKVESMVYFKDKYNYS